MIYEVAFCSVEWCLWHIFWWHFVLVCFSRLRLILLRSSCITYYQYLAHMLPKWPILGKKWHRTQNLWYLLRDSIMEHTALSPHPQISWNSLRESLFSTITKFPLILITVLEILGLSFVTKINFRTKFRQL